MTSALRIATSALAADNTSIETVAQNVANAQTPGYAAETPALVASPNSSGMGVGAGVAVQGIDRATNALLTASALQAQGELSASTTLQGVLGSVEGLFPLGTGTNATGAPQGTGIAGDLSNFWNSWDSLAQNPSSAAARQTTISYAQDVAQGLNQVASNLAQLATGTEGQLSTTVSQVNSLLAKAASLNASILRVPSGDANQLQDQLSQVAATLAKLAGATLQMQSDGTGTFFIGGFDVVQGTNANKLAVQNGGTPAKTVVVDATSATQVPVSGGSMSGLLSALNYYLPTYSTNLDKVATALKTAVNTQLAAGFTATGSPAATDPLFTGTGASGISVSSAIVNDPSLLAASSTTVPKDAVNNGGNAQLLAALGTNPTGADAKYRSLVQSVGIDTSHANSQTVLATALHSQAQASVQAATGVDITEQLTQLLVDQQAYDAAAKIVSIASGTLNALLGAI